MKRLSHAWLACMLVIALVTLPACTTETTDNGTTDGDEIGSVTVMGVWGGGELEAFQDVAAGWEEATGGTVEFESTRDLSAILTARVSGGNPPDLAILPNPAVMQTYAESGDLLALDDVLDMTQIESDYSDAWIDLGTVDGNFYGVFVKAATKGTVWYNPSTFEAGGYDIPTTWDELIALSDEMVAAGQTPWSIGIEAGGATGWAASDWIQEIYLANSGGEMYDQWVDHEIPWTDPSVKEAFELFGEIALNDDYVVGGVNNILATTPEDASYLIAEDPPGANMYFLGAFTQGFIEGQFPDAVPGEDYDFFDFVSIDPMYEGAETGGADVAVMFNDTPSARSFMEYMADGANWESWASAGGFSSPSQALDPSAYPDELSAKAAAQLSGSEIFRFDADDLMPAEVQSTYWNGIISYLQNPDMLDTILADIEAAAVTAYAE